MRAAPRSVSVVVPVRNEATDLPDQLAALAAQTHAESWELLVVDNGSTDGTRDVVRRWQDRLPQLRLVDASDRIGLNHARNAGIRAAEGEFLAFCDGDDVVGPEWLAALVTAAPGADIVAGSLQRGTVPGDVDGTTYDDLPVKHEFLPAIAGGNCGMWTTVARALMFDEEFAFGGSDIELSWRAILAGYTITTAPDAVVWVRVPAELRTVARQWRAYGESGPALYRTFRTRGMPRARVKDALRAWGWIALHVPDVARGDEARAAWTRVASSRVGRIRGSVRHRVVFL